MLKKIVFHSLLTLFLLSACAREEEIELTISAAASLADSLLEIEEVFREHFPNVQLHFNIGGSGTLRKQIEQGAPVHLFLSASSLDYEILVQQNLIHEGSSPLGNELVLIRPIQGELQDLSDLQTGEYTLAIGTPEIVPAGMYAKETFENLKMWETIQANLIFTKDVQQVLIYVEEGIVDAGVVYRTDAIKAEGLIIVEQFDKKFHSSIEYFFAMIESKNDSEGVRKAKQSFYQFLFEEDAQKIFQKNGFQLLK